MGPCESLTLCLHIFAMADDLPHWTLAPHAISFCPLVCANGILPIWLLILLDGQMWIEIGDNEKIAIASLIYVSNRKKEKLLITVCWDHNILWLLIRPFLSRHWLWWWNPNSPHPFGTRLFFKKGSPNSRTLIVTGIRPSIVFLSNPQTHKNHCARPELENMDGSHVLCFLFFCVLCIQPAM